MEPMNKSLICPISQDWLEDPIITSCCGQAFSRLSLMDWFKQEQNCPICRADISHFDPQIVPSSKNLIDMVTEAQNQRSDFVDFEEPELKQEWEAKIHCIVNNFTVIGKMELINKNKQSNFKTLFIPVIDKSGSMSGSAFGQVRYSLNRIIDLTYKNSHLITNLVSYCDKASTIVVDTNNPQSYYEGEITRLQAGGGTSFQSAFTELIKICDRYKDDHLISSMVILFLTDGEDSTVTGDKRTDLVKKLKFDIEAVWLKQFIVHTIGFTGNHDHNFLNELRLIGKEGAYRYADPSEDNDCISSKINSILDVVANSTAVPLQLLPTDKSPPIIQGDSNVYWIKLSNFAGIPQYQLILGDSEPITIKAEFVEGENDPVVCEQWYNILISQIATELILLSNKSSSLEKDLHIEIILQRSRAIKSRLLAESATYRRLEKLMETLAVIETGGVVDQRKLNDAKYEGKFQTKNNVTLPTQNNLLLTSFSTSSSKCNSWDIYPRPTFKRCYADQGEIFLAIGTKTITEACNWLTNNLQNHYQEKDKNGANALIVASSIGRINLVRIMVDSGLFKLSATNIFGYNAADMAVLFGWWITFDILITAGCYPSLNGDQLLRTCLSKGHFNLADRLVKNKIAIINNDMEDSAPNGEIVKWLNLKAMKDVSLETAIMKGMYEEVLEKYHTVEKISLQNYRSIFITSNGDHIKILQLLIDKIDLNETYDDHEGDVTWPLFIASEKGNLRMVKFLLEHTDINKQNLRGTTALWIASCNKHTDVVLQLLDAKADPNIANFKGDSPLIPACQKGSESIVQLLLEGGADYGLHNKNRDNPILICCRTGQAKILEILLRRLNNDELKSILSTYAEIDGFVPLLAATELDKVECIKVCLKYGADIEERSKDDNQIISGATALHLAAYYGRFNAFKTLIDNGANIIAQTSTQGYTALHIAIKQGHTEIARYLLGTKEGKQCLSVKDSENRLPIYYANKEGNEVMLEELFTNKLEKILNSIMFSEHDDEECSNILVKYGQSPGCYEYSEITGIVGKNGSSLLSNALLSNNIQLAETFLVMGANVNSKDDYGITPIFWQILLGKDVDNVNNETKLLLDNLQTVKNRSKQNKLLLNFQPQRLIGSSENNNILSKMKDGYSLKVHRNVIDFLKKSLDDEHSLLTFIDKMKGNKMVEYALWLTKIHLVRIIASGEKVLNPEHLVALYLYSSSRTVFENANLTISKYKENNIWNPFVCCLYQAINLLPAFEGEVYRAIDINFNRDHFEIGSTIVWNTFVICSKDYASSTELINKKRGIIFIVKSKTGRDISKYCYNPVDAEIVFNPGTSVKITSYYAPSIICLGQANIRKSTYAIKENDIIKATNKEACIIIELEEF